MPMCQRGKSSHGQQKPVQRGRQHTPDANTERCQHGPEDELDDGLAMHEPVFGPTHSTVHIGRGKDESKPRECAGKGCSKLLVFPATKSDTCCVYERRKLTLERHRRLTWNPYYRSSGSESGQSRINWYDSLSISGDVVHTREIDLVHP